MTLGTWLSPSNILKLFLFKGIFLPNSDQPTKTFVSTKIDAI